MTNDRMTNEEASNTLKSLKEYYNDKNEDSYVGFDNEDNEALDLAIKALEQTERIAKLVNELHLEDVSPKDFDNMFYLQSVKEIKEEMWQMYCFAEDVGYTLDL